eukprot:4799190-Pleurochrysis_carterae.AAC.1
MRAERDGHVFGDAIHSIGRIVVVRLRGGSPLRGWGTWVCASAVSMRTSRTCAQCWLGESRKASRSAVEYTASDAFASPIEWDSMGSDAQRRESQRGDQSQPPSPHAPCRCAAPSAQGVQGAQGVQ